MHFLTCLSQYLGNSKHIVAYPISHLSNPMINLVAFTSEPEKEGTRISGAWVRSAPNANLLDEFTDWEDEVRVLLEVRISQFVMEYT